MQKILCNTFNVFFNYFIINNFPILSFFNNLQFAGQKKTWTSFQVDLILHFSSLFFAVVASPAYLSRSCQQAAVIWMNINFQICQPTTIPTTQQTFLRALCYNPLENHKKGKSFNAERCVCKSIDIIYSGIHAWYSRYFQILVLPGKVTTHQQNFPYFIHKVFQFNSTFCI